MTRAIACLILGGVGLAAYWPRPTPPAGDQEKTKPEILAVKQIERVDAMGDPLPPDALMRLGSIRLLHGVTLQALAYCPTRDQVASGGWDPNIRVWDVASGKEVLVIAGPKKGVHALAYSPDGKWLAGGGIDGIVYLWDGATGKEVRRLEGSGAEISALKFSRQGEQLAAAAKRTVRLWEVATGTPGARLDLKEEDGDVAALDFGPDGQSLIVAGGKSVHLWQIKSDALRGMLRVKEGPVTSALFSKDGKHLLIVGNDGIRILSVADGKKVHDVGGARFQGGAAALSADGKILAVGDHRAVVHLWDWAANKQVLELAAVPDRVRCLAFSSDGKTLAALADGAPIHLWDAATGKRRIVAPGHQERVTAVACLRNGKVATAAWDGTVRLWDPKTGKEIRRMELEPDKERAKVSYPQDAALLRTLSVSQDDKLIAAVLGHEVAVIWEAATGKEIRRLRASCVAFSPDGKLIACGERDMEQGSYNVGIIRLYDRATGKELQALRGHLTPIASMAFTPDSKTLVSQGIVFFGLRSGEPGESETKFVRIWDVASGKERPTFAPGAGLRGAILSPNGKTVASFSFLGNNINLWETVTGRQRGELTGNKDMVFDVAFSPDSRLVASAGMDGSVRLYDCFSAKEVGRLEGHRGWVQAVAFAADGKTLVSGGIDTTALVWDLSRFTSRGQSKLTDAELATCWEDLGRDAEIASRAMGRLLAAPEQTLALFRKNLKPAPSAASEQITQLIGELDSKDFKTRERATQELEKLGDVAAPAVQRALDDKLPLEMRRRLESLLQKLEGATLPPDTQRQVRAVEVLQGIGTVPARELLEDLAAKGAPDARLTREAKAALRQ